MPWMSAASALPSVAVATGSAEKAATEVAGCLACSVFLLVLAVPEALSSWRELVADDLHLAQHDFEEPPLRSWNWHGVQDAPQ